MKLIRKLTVSDKTYPVIEERLLLELNTAGRAQFMIDAPGFNPARFSAVAFDIGYSQHGQLSRLFLGYVEQFVRVDARRVRIFCREWGGMLHADVPLNLRHPTVIDVLMAIHAETQLNFSVPEAAYSRKKMPHFAHVGTGYQALSLIGRVFGIDDMIWQQQGGGAIYVGSWADSRWPSRQVQFQESMFKSHLSSQTAEIAAVPELRPGAVVNGRRLKSLEFTGNSMLITWV